MIKEAQVEVEEAPEGSEPLPMKNVVTKIAEKLKDRLVGHIVLLHTDTMLDLRWAAAVAQTVVIDTYH